MGNCPEHQTRTGAYRRVHSYTFGLEEIAGQGSFPFDYKIDATLPKCDHTTFPTQREQETGSI
ncbi:hypothetical protein R50076_00790 [Gilvimarinus japonicus]